jgi:hypothetical protein
MGKAKIVKIGSVDEKTKTAYGWEFDGLGTVVGLSVNDHYEVTMIGGYTIEELAEIAKNPNIVEVLINT